MTSYAIRYLFRLGLWLLALVAVVAINFETLMSTYMAYVSGLELLGYETKPVIADRLVGSFLSAWFPGASMVQFIALALVSAEFAGFFFFFHLFYTLCGLYQHRNASKNDPVESGAARDRLIRTVCEMGFLGLCLGFLVSWEYVLFKFRAVCGTLGLEDPFKAAGTVSAWRTQTAEKGGLYAIDIIPLSGLGYIALIVVSTWSLEFLFQRIGEDFTQLMAILLIPFEWARRVIMGLFERPTALSPVAGDVGTSRSELELPEEEHRQADADRVRPEPDLPSPSEAIPPTEARADVDRDSEATLVEVIGGMPGQRVLLSEARNYPDCYFVHPLTGTVYHADYWNRLN